MDRDEILRRSRAEKEDEGNTFLENRGRRWGVIGFCAMTIVLLVFNLAAGQNSYSILAMFWSYASLEAWAKYRASRRLMGGDRLQGSRRVCAAGAHLLSFNRKSGRRKRQGGWA